MFTVRGSTGVLVCRLDPSGNPVGLRPPARRVRRSRYSAAASWPQAPSISRPRVSRTVTGMPWCSRRRTKARSSSGREAVHFEPGGGVERDQVDVHELVPEELAEQVGPPLLVVDVLDQGVLDGDAALGLRRVVPGGVEDLGHLPPGVDRHQGVKQLVVGSVQGQRQRQSRSSSSGACRDSASVTGRPSAASLPIAGTSPTVETVTPRAEMPRPPGEGSVIRRTAPITAL
jgi:hypothetical protein